MKHLLTILFSFLLVTGCDDGDIIEETFNFESATVQKCSSSSVLFKINDKEALILSIPEASFPNEETTAGMPRIVTIGGSASVTYKKYNSATNSSNTCDTPTITVLEEWNAIGGTVEITSTKIFGTNGTTVVAYNHNIIFKNITFQAPNTQVVYDTYSFGNYRTDVTDLTFNFVTPDEVLKCNSNNLIYKYNSSKALLLDVDKSVLFQNTVTPVGSPRTALINTTTNKIVYRVYNGGLNSNYFCAAITPSTPTLTEEWIADNGVDNVSGIIKVVTETTAVPNEFKHTIYLHKVTFRKGFQYYSPNPDGDYLFGTYYTNL